MHPTKNSAVTNLILELDEDNQCFKIINEAELRMPSAIEFAEQAGFFVKIEPHVVISE